MDLQDYIVLVVVALAVVTVFRKLGADLRPGSAQSPNCSGCSLGERCAPNEQPEKEPIVHQRLLVPRKLS